MNLDTFQVVESQLSGRCKDRRKVANNTYLERRDDGAIALRLHATDVVTYYPDRLVLDSGGWRTVTTKDRLGFTGLRVYSVRGVWYVRSAPGWEGTETDLRYFDGIAFDYEGKCLNPEFAPADNSRQVAKLKREIAAFAKLATEKLREGIAHPGAGDCWYCLMRTEDGTALDDATANHDHLRSHMEEGYIVPSLLASAVTEAGYRHPGIILGASEDGTMGGMSGDRPRAFEDAVRRSVAKYLKRRLLPTETGGRPVGEPAHTGGFAVR